MLAKVKVLHLLVLQLLNLSQPHPTVPMKRITTFIAFLQVVLFQGLLTILTVRAQLQAYTPGPVAQALQIGNQTTDRHVLPEQAMIDKIYKGRGELEEIELSWPTLQSGL